MTIKTAVIAAAALCAVATSASAQVRYQPYPYAPQANAPTPYGYPVPGGFLQPDETLGTSPSFVFNTSGYPGQPAVTVIRRCQYPNGWNVTDFSRDVNGIPAGRDHDCPVRGVRSAY